MPAYIHSDRGNAFMSAEFKRYLLDKGIASSRTTSYNPAGNGQVERLNQTLWQTIKLGLKTHKLPLQHWQELLKFKDLVFSIASPPGSDHETFSKHVKSKAFTHYNQIS